MRGNSKHNQHAEFKAPTLRTLGQSTTTTRTSASWVGECPPYAQGVSIKTLVLSQLGRQSPLPAFSGTQGVQSITIHNDLCTKQRSYQTTRIPGIPELPTRDQTRKAPSPGVTIRELLSRTRPTGVWVFRWINSNLVKHNNSL